MFFNYVRYVSRGYIGFTPINMDVIYLLRWFSRVLHSAQYLQLHSMQQPTAELHCRPRSVLLNFFKLLSTGLL